jgi:hypothetical protein
MKFKVHTFIQYSGTTPTKNVRRLFFSFGFDEQLSISWNVIWFNISCQQDIAQIPAANKNTGGTGPNSTTVYF